MPSRGLCMCCPHAKTAHIASSRHCIGTLHFRFPAQKPPRWAAPLAVKIMHLSVRRKAEIYQVLKIM